jgi:hypothetical protein
MAKINSLDEFFYKPACFLAGFTTVIAEKDFISPINSFPYYTRYAQ